MILKILKIEYSKIDSNIKPIIDFSFLNDEYSNLFPYPILLGSKDGSYIKIVSKNNSVNTFFVIEMDFAQIANDIEIFFEESNEYNNIIKSLFFNIYDLNNDTVNIEDRSSQKIIFGIFFLFIYLKEILKNRQSLFLFLLFNLYNCYPDTLTILEKNNYIFYFLIKNLEYFNEKLILHLLYIDADKSLLLALQSLIKDITDLNNLYKIFDYALICKINKNRFRRLIDEIYRLNDLNIVDKFLNLLENEKTFFTDSKISSSQKEIRFTNKIERLINPKYYERFFEYTKFINSLNNKILNIKPSSFFEKEEFAINAIIRNKSDLEILKNEIIQLLNNKDKLF